MRNLAILGMLVLSAASAVGQGVPHAVIETSQAKMSALSWLEGEWNGDAWMQMGPEGRAPASVHEIATYRLERTLLILEGRGEKEDGSVVHEALGIISFDPGKNAYAMKAYRPGGLSVDADIEVTESGLIWEFEVENVGRMRYTVTHAENGEWQETGEMSRDGGQTWFPFFGMTLTSVSN